MLPRTIFVKEVVREPRMHFYKVPRLGCYMAIRLEYESCLFEESLDAAVIDYIDVKNRQKEQDDEKKSFIAKQAEEDREDADQTFDSANLSTNRRWEDIKPKPFKTKKIQFVVCMNTLGQDREFSQDEVLFAQRTVRDFAKSWENIEHKNLEQDVFLRIASIEHDAEYKKTKEPHDNADLEKKVEESILPREGEDPLEDDVKAITQKKTRFKLMTKAFYFDEKAAKPKFRDHGSTSIEGGGSYNPLPANQWREAILTFAKYHVVKMPRIFQAIFYLLGYTREEICERDTNKIDWKKASLVLQGGPTGDGSDFFKRIGDYNPFGPKEDAYTLY